MQLEFRGRGFLVHTTVGLCERVSNIKLQTCFKAVAEHINLGLRNGRKLWKEERDHPALWKVKSMDYCNKIARYNGLTALQEILKDLIFNSCLFAEFIF